MPFMVWSIYFRRTGPVNASQDHVWSVQHRLSIHAGNIGETACKSKN